MAEKKTNCNMQLLINHATGQAKVSIILLDWGVRESFHSIHYLHKQTVAREKYELIWVEFYDRKPDELVRLAKSEPGPMLDKWLVMGYPEKVHYHKHRMYNAGIVLAHGEICVFCDSDAMFEPTFVETILKAFEERPNAVIHLDEVRNSSKRFYPFNYPAVSEVLRKDCLNWTGKTTTGLDNNPDMLHAANYGACMAARRDDLIRIGGADEHIDYLGYICGPYELTFRLTNLGREEHWLQSEFLYHVWHPNTSGCNVEYKGPEDGKGHVADGPGASQEWPGAALPGEPGNQASSQRRRGNSGGLAGSAGSGRRRYLGQGNRSRADQAGTGEEQLSRF